MNSFSARPRESVFVTWVSAGLCSLPACLPGGQRVIVSEHEPRELLGIMAASLSFPRACWTYRELGKFAWQVFYWLLILQFQPERGRRRGGVYAFKDRGAALTSDQGVLRHCFLWQRARSGHLDSFQGQGSREQQPLPASLTQEGRPGVLRRLAWRRTRPALERSFWSECTITSSFPLLSGISCWFSSKEEIPCSPNFCWLCSRWNL